MPETNFRALCAELLTAIQLYTKLNHAASEMSAFELTEKLMDAMAATNAALAQPEPVAPTESDVTELFYRHMGEGSQVGFENAVAEALARWGTPAIQPVPVSERLPGPEDCDAEGRCWWWHPDHKEDDFDDGWILLNPKWASGRRDSDDSLIYTHWLPHWALPVPANTTKEAQ
jgi:hypothetical protein